MNLELNQAGLHPGRHPSRMIGKRSNPRLEFHPVQTWNPTSEKIGPAATMMDLKMITTPSGHGVLPEFSGIKNTDCSIIAQNFSPSLIA